MSDVILSRGIRDNLLSLQNTADLLAQTQKRLSTGRKVNSALDNPTTFFTAQGLNSRANDLSGLLDSISNAQKTIEAADKGITSINKLLESAKSTANQARLDSSPASVASITSASIDGAVTKSEAAAKELVGDLGLAANNTIRINTSDSVAGTSAQFDITVATGTTVQDVVDQINANGSAVASISVDGKLKIEANNTNSSISVQIDTATPATFTNERDLVARLLGSGVDNDRAAASSAFAPAQLNALLDNDGTPVGGSTLTGASTLDALGFADGDIITLAVGSNSIDFTVTDANGADDIDALVAALDAISGATVTFNGSEELQVVLDDSTSTDSIKLSVDVVAGSAANIAARVGATATSDGLSELGALVASAEGGGAGASAARIQLAGQFNELRSQIDKLAADASFNGVNLLNGDNLEVIFNEKTGADRNSLTISGVTYSAASLGVKDAANGVTGYNNFASNADVERALEDIANSIGSLKVQSSTFGSNLSIVQARQDFTKNLITTLQTGSDNLVLSDQNEEAANLLALQTRQTLSQTALSLASQSDQSVLRLFS
ncbi:MAG: flagellin [Pseudomonadota bacterium]